MTLVQLLLPVLPRNHMVAGSQSGKRSPREHVFLKICSRLSIRIKSIQPMTKMSRNIDSGTASHETNFWLSMEVVLEGIEQLRSSEDNLPWKS